MLAAGAVTAAVGADSQLRLQGSSESVTIGLTILGEVTGTTVDFIAIPEKRIPSSGNDSTLLTLEVRSPGSVTPLFSTGVTTTVNGTYSGLLLIDIDPGTYDVTAKGFSHLRLKQSSVEIAANGTIDFSDGGVIKLLSGDVNGTDGDNFVNGIDLSLIVGGLLGSGVRYDLNRDGLVNGIDLSNAVSNILVSGDA